MSSNGKLLDLKGPSHAQAHTADLPADAELVLPERVTVVLTELAGAARKGLRALAVRIGLGRWEACSASSSSR
jgi:hypothetical protein